MKLSFQFTVEKLWLTKKSLKKDWDSPFYDGDRLEIYSPLLIDPMEARRKKANKNKDARLQAKAAGRKGRFLSRS